MAGPEGATGEASSSPLGPSRTFCSGQLFPFSERSQVLSPGSGHGSFGLGMIPHLEDKAAVVVFAVDLTHALQGHSGSPWPRVATGLTTITTSVAASATLPPVVPRHLHPATPTPSMAVVAASMAVVASPPSDLQSTGFNVQGSWHQSSPGRRTP